MNIRLANKFSKYRRSLLSLIALLTAAAYCTTANASLCIIPTEVGTWVNSDPNTSGVTKVIYEARCVDASTRTCNGNICTVTSAVRLELTTKVWGKCHPTDCYWGEEEAVYTSSDWMRSFYDHGFATRSVWGQIWSGSNDWLRVIVDTDFESESREDYRFSGWFRRQ